MKIGVVFHGPYFENKVDVGDPPAFSAFLTKVTHYPKSMKKKNCVVEDFCANVLSICANAYYTAGVCICTKTVTT